MAETSKPVEVYYMPLSAPCRAVLLLAKSIGLQVTPKLCNIMAGDNRTPHYLKVSAGFSM